jgi:hypothetical protein
LNIDNKISVKLVGFGLATRPFAARTYLFRLITMQNRALPAPRPALITNIMPMPGIEPRLPKLPSLGSG